MSKSSGLKADITASGAGRSTARSSDIAGSHPENKQPVLEVKSRPSANNTPKPGSPKTLAQGSTSTGEGFKPYWNKQCAELNSMLWLPHKTASAGRRSRSSDGSSNYTVEGLRHWKKTIKPTSLTPEPCLPSLPPSVPVTTENAQVVGSRKIRIYPQDESRYFDLVSLSRRAYNLAVAWLKAQERVDLKRRTEVRGDIREQVRSEWAGRTFSSIVADEAVSKAFDTFKACLRKWSTGQKARMRFRSRKDPVQRFIITRLSTAGSYPRALGGVHITEDIPEEAIGKMAVVTRCHGRWYLSVKKMITVCKRENQAHNVVALDPGVRTFMTAFSPLEAIEFGNGYASDRIVPLLRKKDTLIGKRQRLLNKRCDEQWWRDQMRCVDKRLDRLSARIDDQVSDLHRRTAHDLVTRYDAIICPPFETLQMVAKEGRKLRKSSVRQM